MTDFLFQLVGGLGIFLLGMLLLTDGMKSFAGEALRRSLVRFTGTPFKAFASGTLVTLAVQSSSATTVTVIGFVSAGLLTFPQALGVVFGASLGTTGTSWIVAELGLKISLGYYALPLVGAGAFLKLLGRGRWRPLGLALAGFGLIFVGIDTLREGMQGAASSFNLDQIPHKGVGGYLIAIGIGAAMTVAMQSSSAAVATILTALHAGAINFEQAAALVIGAAVGTTVTGPLAAIGAGVPAKRTALAHVLFNLATGLIAAALLPWFLRAIVWGQDHLGLDLGATSLAAFHTLFIGLGVILFLPWVNHFARGIERLLPDRGPRLTRHLDKTVLQTPEVALEATRRALTSAAREAFLGLDQVLSGPPGGSETERRNEIAVAVDEIQRFLALIPPLSEDHALSRSRLAQMHAIDHLIRLSSRLTPSAATRKALALGRLAPALDLAKGVVESGAEALAGGAMEEGWLAEVEAKAARLAELRRQDRPRVIELTGSGGTAPGEVLDLLDAMRWLDRVGYHGWRICHHLAAKKTGDDDGDPPAGDTDEHLPDD